MYDKYGTGFKRNTKNHENTLRKATSSKELYCVWKKRRKLIGHISGLYNVEGLTFRKFRGMGHLSTGAS